MLPLDRRSSRSPTGARRGALSGEPTMKSRLDEVEEALGLHAELHGNFKEKQAQVEAHHASIGERVDYLEKAFGDSADKHAKELEAAHNKLQELHGLHSNHAKGMQDHHASMEERVNFVEQLLGDSADKRAEQQSKARRSWSAPSQSDAGAIVDRLRELESVVGDTHAKHGQALDTHAK